MLLTRAALITPKNPTTQARANTKKTTALFDTINNLKQLTHATALATTLSNRLDDITATIDNVVQTLITIKRVTNNKMVTNILNQLDIFCYHFFTYNQTLQLYKHSNATARHLKSR